MARRTSGLKPLGTVRPLILVLHFMWFLGLSPLGCAGEETTTQPSSPSLPCQVCAPSTAFDRNISPVCCAHLARCNCICPPNGMKQPISCSRIRSTAPAPCSKPGASSLRSSRDRVTCTFHRASGVGGALQFTVTSDRCDGKARLVTREVLSEVCSALRDTGPAL